MSPSRLPEQHDGPRGGDDLRTTREVAVFHVALYNINAVLVRSDPFLLKCLPLVLGVANKHSKRSSGSPIRLSSAELGFGVAPDSHACTGVMGKQIGKVLRQPVKDHVTDSRGTGVMKAEKHPKS
jgi:hypothetical protein